MFNKKILFIGATAAVFSFAAMSGYADSRMEKISDFTSLSVSKGLDVEVNCGAAPSMGLEGPALNNVKFKQDGKTLSLTYDKAMFSRLSGDDVEVKLTVTKPVDHVMLSDGVKFKIKACAVGKDFSLKMEKGTKANVSGVVDNLNLMMTSGAKFNNDDQKITMNKVTVAMSRGTKANLCGAKEIVGTASTGAEIKAAKNADIKVNLTSGADVDRDDCS